MGAKAKKKFFWSTTLIFLLLPLSFAVKIATRYNLDCNFHFPIPCNTFGNME